MALPALPLTLLLVLAPLLLAREEMYHGPMTVWVHTEAGRCTVPSGWDPKLQFKPTKEYYTLNEVVRLSCAGKFVPSVPLIQCISRGTRTLWNDTATCKELCQRPASWDPRLQLAPDHDTYRENEEVTLSCNSGLQPSFTHVKCANRIQPLNYSGSLKGDMWLGRKGSDVWIQVEENIACLEKCQKPQWDPKFIFDQEQGTFNPNEVVKMRCPEGHWPPPMEIKCVALKPRERSMIPRSGWIVRNGTDTWHVMEDNVTCVDVLQVVPETLKISSTSIKLNWTCRFPDMCQHIRARCRLEHRSSSICEAEEVKGEEMLQGQVGTFTCSPLQPFTVYSVTISLLPSTILYTRLLRTKEMVPDKPEDLKMDTKRGSLRWKMLPSCKGEIIGYQLNITTMRAEDGSFLEFSQVLVNQSVSEYKPFRQTAGSKYLVTVQGLTAAGAGAASQLEFHTYVVVTGQPLGPWPGSAVTVVVVVVVLIPLSAGILWFWLCRKKRALPSKAEEDHYTELQPYENVHEGNYCMMKNFLAEKDAGKYGQAGQAFPKPLPVLEFSGESEQ